MKFNYYTLLSLLALLAFCSGCSKTATDDPTPTPTPDYSSCRYTFNYKLSYSPLNKNKPTTITYLDADQKVKTAILADTSFNLTLTYKYGDSVYVKLSPSVYFLSKPVAGVTSANNKIAMTTTLAAPTGTCSVGQRMDSNQSASFATDSIPLPAKDAFLQLYGVSPTRLTN